MKQIQARDLSFPSLSSREIFAPRPETLLEEAAP